MKAWRSITTTATAALLAFSIGPTDGRAADPFVSFKKAVDDLNCKTGSPECKKSSAKKNDAKPTAKTEPPKKVEPKQEAKSAPSKAGQAAAIAAGAGAVSTQRLDASISEFEKLRQDLEGLDLALEIGPTLKKKEEDAKTTVFVQAREITPISIVDVSEDGRWMLTGGQSNKLSVWDVHSRRLYGTINIGNTRVALSARLSNDGRFVLAKTRGTLGDEAFHEQTNLYDVQAGKEFVGDHDENLNNIRLAKDISFQAENARFLSGSELVIPGWTDEKRPQDPCVFSVVDLVERKVLPPLMICDGKRRQFDNYTYQVSRDGRYLLVEDQIQDMRSAPKHLSLWDVTARQPIGAGVALSVQATIHFVTISPQGRYVAAIIDEGGNGACSLAVWRAADWGESLRRKLEPTPERGGGDPCAAGVILSDKHDIAIIHPRPDSEFIGSTINPFSLYEEEKLKESRAFDLKTGKEKPFSGPAALAWSLSSDQSFLFASGSVVESAGKLAAVLALPDFNIVSHLPDTEAVGHLGGGRGFVFANGPQMVEHNPLSGATAVTFDGLEGRAVANVAQRGEQLIVRQSGRTVVWNMTEGRPNRVVDGIGEEPIRNKIMTELVEGDIYVKKLSEMTTTSEEIGHYWGGLSRIDNDVTDRKEIVVFDFSGAIEFVDLKKKKHIRIEGPFSSGENFDTYVSLVRYAADNTLVLAGSTDGRIAIIDAKAKKTLKRLSGHGSEITYLGLTADGKRLISGSRDGVVKLWDMGSGAEIIQMIARSENEWLAITPEGFYASSAKAPPFVNVRSGGHVYGVDQFQNLLYRPDLVQAKLAGDPAGDVRKAAASVNLAEAIVGGAPPRVSIESTQFLMAQSSIQSVSIRIEDTGGGVGRVEWRINGVAVEPGDGERGLARPPEAGGATTRLTKNIRLEPGENHVEVTAFNKSNAIASPPVGIKIRLDMAALRPPELHILAIGVNDYEDPSLRLKYSVADAKAVADKLKSVGSKLFSKVHTTVILDKEATGEGIGKAFAAMSAAVDVQDVFVLMVAGHGKTHDGKFYYLPQDFKAQGADFYQTYGVSQSMWQAWLGRIAARKSMLIFDTCESGSLTGAAFATRGLDRITAVDKLSRAMGRTVIAAASATEPALEGLQGHGVLSYTLLEALADKPAEADGYIRVTDLVRRIDDRVPLYSAKQFGEKKRQIPTTLFQGNDFLIGVPVSVADMPEASVVRTSPYVIVVSTSVRDRADPSGEGLGELQPGVQVERLEAAEGETPGWIKIMRNARILGFVQASAVVPLR